MTVEVNVIYREKTAAVVVPAEAVIDNAVQIVRDGKVERVPVTVGIRGSRNVEIIGDVRQHMTVLSPARADLADGTRVRVDDVMVPAKQATDVPADPAPDPVPSPTPDRSTASAPVETSVADPDNAVISAALSAHVDSIVNDARRNVGRYPAAR
jgi:hypothetical protein